MHLARTSISTLPKPKHNSLVLSRPDPTHFTLATDGGFELWQLEPLRFVLRRDLPGSLGHASCYGRSSLFFLVGGGGPAPVFAPNKVVLWDESRAAAVIELEFKERVLGLESRPGLLAVVLLRRVVLYEIDTEAAAPASSGTGASSMTGGSPSVKGKQKASSGSGKPRVLRRIAEWPTVDNPLGLIAMASAPGSSLLAIPGRQAGHIHLLHVHPAPPASASSSSTTSAALPPTRSQIVIAHTTSISTLSCSPTGSLVATTSARGTLVRVFSGRTGALERELRRGADKAVTRQGGVAFGGGHHGARAAADWLAVWSDKGTVHAFSLDSTAAAAGGRSTSGGGGSAGKDVDEKLRNRPSTFSKLLPYLPSPLALPKYFLSEWAHATYTLPTVDRHSTTLASLGSTLARGAAKAAAAASGTGGGSDASSSREGDRLTFDDDDDDEEERCVLAWVEVDIERERARLRARQHSGTGATTHAKVQMNKQSRRLSNLNHTAGNSGSDPDDDAYRVERALHPSSLPRPAPPAILPPGSPGGRARAAGALHTPHRRDIEPSHGRRAHLGGRGAKTTVSTGGGFRTDTDHRPRASHRSSSTASSSAGKVAGGGRHTEAQLVALTFSGGFYRLALPASLTLGSGDALLVGGRSSPDGGPVHSDDDDKSRHSRRSNPTGTGGSSGNARELRLAEYRRFGAAGGGFALNPGEDGRPWNEVGEW